MPDFDVDIQHACTVADLPDDSSLRRWAVSAWLQDYESEVTLRLVDARESAELNDQFRQKAYPTNVLSFLFEQPIGVTVPLAGDLVICAGVVAKEALEQHKSRDAHWAHMVIHGMLHLQGYDHMTEGEASEMEAIEIRLLRQLGYSNPYITQPDIERDMEQDMEQDS
jgi:probable rRNA maturation factor